jgi:sucrose-6-phosphate hydrolase SacC (GH32 family)
VLDLGNPGDYDDKSVESPTVVKLGDNSYVMWYRGQSWADKTGRVMRAVSKDGLAWTKMGMVMTPSADYEGDKIDPMTVMYEEGTYKMWYGAEAYGGCACYATSTDGITWNRYEGNPVLRKTSGAWDNEGAGGQHSVIKIGGKYEMYYKGYGSQAPGWTFYGRAESSDGIHWAKKGKILSPDPAIGDTTTFRNLCAFQVDNNYCIMFTMVEYLNLFLASSKDGNKWVKNGLVFAHGSAANSYDEKWSTSPSISVEGNTIRMWYEGGDPNGRVRTLYAEIYKAQLIKAFKNVVVKR